MSTIYSLQQYIDDLRLIAGVPITLPICVFEPALLNVPGTSLPTLLRSV